MSAAKPSRDQRVQSRHPLMIALWFVLVVGYLTASTAGFRVTAMAIVGLMAVALIAASGQLVFAAITGAAIGWLCFFFPTSIQFIVYVPTLAAFAFMAWFFYWTLRVGQEPLITRIARMEHPELPQSLVQYTRMLTWAWSLCFVLLFIVALLLAPRLALDEWSHWVHGLGYVVPGALFIGEYAYRLIRYRGMHHSSIPKLITNTITVCRDVALSSSVRNTQPDPDR